MLMDLVRGEMDGAYRAAEGLVQLVRDDELGWKPPVGKNWMTVGQLLEHLSSACGFVVRGFVTGDWSLPDGTRLDDLKPEEMLLPAEKMPRAESVAEALQKLEADRRLAIEMLERAGEKALAERTAVAPWGGPPLKLAQQILHAIGHLANHKAQLFYYLKLMGRDVHTGHLYGA